MKLVVREKHGKTMARRAQLDCQVGLEVRQLGFAGSRYIYSCEVYQPLQMNLIKYSVNIH